MPTVNIRMYEGRSEETKDTLAKEVKEVVANHTKNKVESVTVIFDEIPRPADKPAPVAQS